MKNLTISVFLFLFISIAALLNAKGQGITPDSAKSYLLNRCYDIMKQAEGFGSLLLGTNIASDETYGGGGINDGNDQNDLDLFTVTSSNSYILSIWDKYYESIIRCNNLINAIGTTTDNDLNRYLAESKFLRAHFYFGLVRSFGGVPLFISADTSQLRTLSRASVSEVYTQIENDLTQAISYLPLRSALTVEEKFRVTKGAAQALLGKAYLYEQKYIEASQILSNVINSSQYNLLAHFSQVWQNINEFSFESIFEVPFTSIVGDWKYGNSDVMLMGFRGGTSSGNTYHGGWGLASISPVLVQAFNNQNDSVRKKYTIVDAPTIVADGCSIWIADSRDYTGYFNNKYAALKADFIYPTLSEKNTIYLRYAEVLLMAAEANFKIGNEINALMYLNQVHQRAKLNPVSFSGQDLLNAIKDERRFELALEGNRFFDLVRWGDASTVLASTGYKSHNNVWPIPRNALIRNPNLLQNPGYDGTEIIKTQYFGQINLMLSPNPVRDKSILKFNLLQPDNANISVYSITGKAIKYYNLGRCPAGNNSFELDMTSLPSGVYSIVLKSGSKFSIIKAIVQ